MKKEISKTTGRIDPLTLEEELHLGRIIQKHYTAKRKLNSQQKLTEAKRRELEEQVAQGEQAVDTLVRANLGLVYARAHAFKRSFPSGPELDDLIQEGMVGLMDAVEKYDPKRGNKFSTVATWWIRQKMTRGTNKTHHLVRLPENRIYEFSNFNKIHNDPALADLSPEERDEVAMKKMNMSKSVLMRLRAAGGSHASLNKVVGGDQDGGGKEFIDYIGESRYSPAAEDTHLREEAVKIVMDTLESLQPLRATVARCALHMDEDGRTPKKLQEDLGLTPQEYRQARNEALQTIRQKLMDEGFTSSATP